MKNSIIVILGLIAYSLSANANEWVNISTPQWINEIEWIDGNFYIASNGGLVIYDPVTKSKEHFLPADGLPSSKIEDVVKGPDGNIWIGTYDNGVAYLENGEWVKVFNPLATQTSNLLLTYCLAFDENDVLWTGTSAGLQKYENGVWTSESWQAAWDLAKMPDGSLFAASFLPFKIANGQATQDNTCPIFAYSDAVAAVDRDGYRVFGAPGSGIAQETSTGWIIYNDNNSIINAQMQISDIELAADGSLWAIAPNHAVYSFYGGYWKQEFTSTDLSTLNWSTTQIFPSNSGVYIGTNNSLTRYSGTAFYHIDLDFHGLSSNKTELAINEHGTPIVKNEEKLLEFLNPQGIGGMLALPQGLTDMSLTMMVEMPDGKLGLFDRLNGDLWVDGIATSLYTAQTMPFPSINYLRDIHVDVNYNYWIGGLNGLYFTDGQTSMFYDDSNSVFTQPDIWQIGEDRVGNIWVSTPGGIGKWDGNQWFYHDADDHNQLFGAAGLDFHFDEQNELWFAGWGTGLVHFDGTNWEALTTANSDISSNIIYDIEEIEGKLYLATNDGLSVYDGTSFDVFTAENSGMLDNKTRQVKVDGNNNIWIVHPSIGLSVYNKEGVSTSIQIPAAQLDSWSLYPNPTSHFVYIEARDFDINQQLELIDIQGKILEILDPNATKISLNKYEPGVYFVKRGNQTKKVILR